MFPYLGIHSLIHRMHGIHGQVVQSESVTMRYLVCQALKKQTPLCVHNTHNVQFLIPSFNLTHQERVVVKYIPESNNFIHKLARGSVFILPLCQHNKTIIVSFLN